jgi:hypothetical protein
MTAHTFAHTYALSTWDTTTFLPGASFQSSLETHCVISATGTIDREATQDHESRDRFIVAERKIQRAYLSGIGGRPELEVLDFQPWSSLQDLELSHVDHPFLSLRDQTAVYLTSLKVLKLMDCDELIFPATFATALQRIELQDCDLNSDSFISLIRHHSNELRYISAHIRSCTTPSQGFLFDEIALHARQVTEFCAGGYKTGLLSSRLLSNLAPTVEKLDLKLLGSDYFE